MYLEAVSVHHPGGNLRGGGGQEGGGQTASTAVSFSSKDLEFVAKFTQVRGGEGRAGGEKRRRGAGGRSWPWPSPTHTYSFPPPGL